MITRRYNVTITGESPLLMHQDNVTWSDLMKKWRTDPTNKGKSTAGDDRAPGFIWLGSLYHNAGLIAIPSDNLMTVLREGGKRCPTGKGKSTFKAQSQSGIIVDQAAWPLEIPGIGKIPIKEMMETLSKEEDFEKHEAYVTNLGFELFVKRAKIMNAKHVRVRPRFDRWAASGSLTVLDDAITDEVIKDILVHAGLYAGLGDWRPSSPQSPGPFGKFSVSVSRA